MSKINKVVVKGVSYDIEDKNTASKALHYNSFNAIPTATTVRLGGKSVDGTNTLSMNIPAATEEAAGMMTAIDKKKLNNLVIEGADVDLNTYHFDGVYVLSNKRLTNAPILNDSVVSARLTVLTANDGTSPVITQVLNLNNLGGGEGNVYIRANQKNIWKPWGKLQTNVEVGQITPDDMSNLTDNGIYSGVCVDGDTVETFVLIVINNYLAATQAGFGSYISQLKYAIDLNRGNTVKTRTRDAYGIWNEWVSLDEKSLTLIKEEENRAKEAEGKLEEKIAKEKTALINGGTIVGQAREIHSRNGKAVTDSFLVRTTAGSGTIGDGVAYLKSVGGNIVKNLVDGTFESGWNTAAYTVYLNNGCITLTRKYEYSTYLELTGANKSLNVVGHTIYAFVIIKSSTDKVQLSIAGQAISAFNTNTVAKEWSCLSIRNTITQNVIDRNRNYTSIRALNNNNTLSSTDYLAIKSYLVVDLTEMFGAGNEPTKEECDKLFGTMDALPQGLSIAKPTEFKSTGFNQFNPDNVLDGKAIVDNAIVDGDKKIAVIPCLPCKVGTGENNGYCIHGDFGDDIKVYLTPLNPMEVDGELYMHELTKNTTDDTYVPLIKGYMLVEVPTTANLCAHFLWSEDKCERDSYEPYFESKIELPTIPQMSEWGLAGMYINNELVQDVIDLENNRYIKRIGKNAEGFFPLEVQEEYPLPEVDNNYISSDYGVEQFDSVVPCNANNLYYMRSLAGETRNFLDRLYDNTDKTDAKEVADYITNNLDSVEGEFNNIKSIVGEPSSTIDLTASNYSGLIYNGTTFSSASANYDSFIFPLTQGATYKIIDNTGLGYSLAGISSVFTFSIIPTLGDVGYVRRPSVNILKSFTPQDDERYLVLVIYKPYFADNNFTYVSEPTGLFKRVEDLEDNPSKLLQGKTILCLGDSVTELMHQNKRYSDYLAEITGATVINGGIGGTQISRRKPIPATSTFAENRDAYACLDLPSIAHALNTGDFTMQEAAAQWLISDSNPEKTSDDNTAIIETLKGVDLNSVDIVTMFIGTNDIGRALGTIGAPGNDTTALDISQGFHEIIKNLLTKNPNLRIYYYCPMPRYFGDIRTFDPSNSATDPNWCDNYAANGIKFPEMVDHQIKLAQYYKIPVCDMYRTMGINQWNILSIMKGDTSDGTHPYKGLKMLANKIASFITYNNNLNI